MRIFCLLILFLASTAWASRIPVNPLQAPPSPGKDTEDAEVIALVKVMSVSPASTGGEFYDIARAFVNEGIKGVKTGEVIDILKLRTNSFTGKYIGVQRSGLYLMHAKKEPDGTYSPSSLIEGWPDRSVVTRKIEEIRTYLSAIEKAKRKAVQLYPDLGDSRSKLHAEFMRRYLNFRRPVLPPDVETYFEDPNWPVTLARESAEAIQRPVR